MHRIFRAAPIARAVAIAVATGGLFVDAHAQQAFSSAWFAARGAAQNTATQTGRLPNGMPVTSLNSPSEQQRLANIQLQRSIDNLGITAQALAAQQSLQAAARQAAQSDASIPDGLTTGGLKVDTNSLTQGWINANAPTPSVADGKTTVNIKQTADKAILNWETFNVGKNTTVAFDQQRDWAVLNRVNDPQARPSVIQGQIKGDGTVLIANRNGILFTGTSQVDTRNLVAAAASITNDQFRNNGIYGAGTSTPTFTGAAGKVEVQAGAQIATRAPNASTDGGGYVLLLGQEVHNAGNIATVRGQTTLAAGDSFIIKRGLGTDSDPTSTTRGNVVTPQFAANSMAGLVRNTGLIMAREGDVSLVGRDVQQNGVAIATTTVNTRGTLHLVAVGNGAKVALGQGATSAIVVEGTGSALDGQRSALLGPPVDGTYNISPVNDRRDQSRIEITSDGTVDFLPDSLTLATGGQIVVSAATRSLVRDRAQLDVSGAVGVDVSMESNNVKVNVQGNEQRDAPGNRDSLLLNSNDVWIDRRKLVFVAKGTNGYDSDRWYTAGGLLEVGGYLGTQGHTVGEWMAQGGSLTFTGNDVVTQSGSNINLSGGTFNVQTGKLKQTWLKGVDGRLYDASSAPGDLKYTGVYKGFEDVHARWGDKATLYYATPFIGAPDRLENGYTVGRDAGRLVISTKGAVIEGGIVGDVFQGPRQTQAPAADLDSYNQSQNAAARRGQLIVGKNQSMYDKTSGLLYDNLSAVMSQVELRETDARIAAGLDLKTALPTERQGKLVLDTSLLNGFGLGAIRIAAKDKIELGSDLQVASGGMVTLYGNDIAVKGNVVAHGGRIQIGSLLTQMEQNGLVGTIVNPGAEIGNVAVADGVKLDASGLWRNLMTTPEGIDSVPYRDGGSVSILGSGNVALGRGSLIDVSSGAMLASDGKLQGGRGGNVTLSAMGSTATLTLDPDAVMRAYGFSGGGTLDLQSRNIAVGDASAATDAGTLALRTDFFNKGFSSYRVTGALGVAVNDDAKVDVAMPVYHRNDETRDLTTGDLRDAFSVWTPPLYQADAAKAKLTQRKGASLTLQTGNYSSSAADMAASQLTIGKGAVVSVDPGQSITLSAIGQTTVNGTLNAWGGNITFSDMKDNALVAETVNAIGHGRSIWIGESAVLDVAARAAIAVDANGNPYGIVRNGGNIVIGGDIDHASGTAKGTDLFIVVREGARLDASGTQATIAVDGHGPRLVPSNGGNISLASNSGLYLDGAFKAASGGGTAAGGSLSVAQIAAMYKKSDATQRVLAQRELILEQLHSDSPLRTVLTPAQAASALVYGYGRVSVAQIDAGGFDNVSLFAQTNIAGDVSLKLNQNLQFYGNITTAPGSKATQTAHFDVSYLRLAAQRPTGKDGYVIPGQATPPVRATLAKFDAKANLIDVRGNNTINADNIELISRGDLRFMGTVDGWDGAAPATSLNGPGDITLRAAQLYPDTGAGAAVRAGFTSGSDTYNKLRTLTISRTTDTVPDVPYSAFGSLSLFAANVEQGGVVRAPLGRLQVGVATYEGQNTDVVHLLPGSITSVSGAGLLMPYGGTTDGQNWNYNGKTVTFKGVGGGDSRGDLVLGGKSIRVDSGAVVDLTGGGDLTGAGFVSGRGGSTDARFYPLMQVGPNGGLTLPDLKTNPVYAIVPGKQNAYAPSSGGAADPAVGRQVTIGAGVPGLPAGTYTLMPATYALLPGAFRVEINGRVGQGTGASAVAMRNGSWSAAGTLSVAGTGIRDSLASQIILTPADVLRTYSQYNETGYAAFAVADAQRRGIPRPALPADAKTFQLSLQAGAGIDALRFEGEGRFAPAEGGYGGVVSVVVPDSSQKKSIEIVATKATAGFDGVTLRADSLNSIGAARMVIGGMTTVTYGQGGNYVSFGNNNALEIYLRSGAVLSAPEVFLVASELSDPSFPAGLIRVEAGAGINTLGRGNVAYDSTDGFYYRASPYLLAVSNGLLNIVASDTSARGAMEIGVCPSIGCIGTTTLYSKGTIAASTTGKFLLDDAVRYGTRNLTLAVGAINIGTTQALAQVQANGTGASGLAMNQGVLDRLLRGDPSTGAPALETLTLAAANSVNFYGDVSLDTYDKTNGTSSLSRLVLTTPAIYGLGNAATVATIRTANLVWSGTPGAPGTVIAGGAGTGSGTLNFVTDRFEFGFGQFAQPSSITSYDRLALGFATVNINAAERITAQHKGSLSVYQSQGAYDATSGFAYTGGNLNLTTPLMTGSAGSANRITAGGAISVMAPAGTVQADHSRDIDALGADLSLHGDTVRVATAVMLPSGKLTLVADKDLTLMETAQIDMAGRKRSFFDVDKYTWGGDVVLESRNGNIFQSAGSTIDLSAANSSAGTLKAIALADAAGQVDLQGRILGKSTGAYDASGTSVPYKSARVEIRAQTLGAGAPDAQFAALNKRLNDGEVFGGRSFQLKRGDLTIGNELKASEINVSLDNGGLTVGGRVDASGASVGTIRLAAKHGLTLTDNAALDAHGTLLRVDSYGKIIDSPNRAVVELSSGDGTLTLGSGAQIDLRHGTGVASGTQPWQNDGVSRGTLTLNAPRLGSRGHVDDADAATYGDIAIDARSGVTIRGAKSIAVNAVKRYDDAPYALARDANGNVMLDVNGKPILELAAGGRPYQVIDQAYLNAKDDDSTQFIKHALLNANLRDTKLAGLNNANYLNVLHLRPGVEIVSKAADGDIVMRGDIDLSGYRYASINPLFTKTNVQGSGEVGMLTVRAGGNLDIFGSINDGFSPPPTTKDDTGWKLLKGINFGGDDIVVPGVGVTLADGTGFPVGAILNFDLPIRGFVLPPGSRAPVTVTLAQALTLPAGTVLAAAVRDSSGNVLYAAGTLLKTAVTLAANSRLDPGSVFNTRISVSAMIWPKGVPLPGVPDTGTDTLAKNFVYLNGPKALATGAIIPSGTDVKLPGDVDSVALRPEVAGSQGKAWALAQMLPEGSQSWSMRLVAGADIEAADSRVVQTRPVHGDLRLADSHYGMYGKGVPPKGVAYWTQAAGDLGIDGIVPGEKIDPDFLKSIGVDQSIDDFCKDSPEYCSVKVSYTWTQKGVDEFADPSVHVGDVVDTEGLGWPTMCEDNPGWCTTPGMTYAYSPTSQRFSVLRTGTGDLELLSGGNLRMDSLFGVYTAGTSSSATRAGDPYNQPRGTRSDGKVLSEAAGNNEGFVNGGNDNLYRAWYPDQGGNLLLRVGGNLTSSILQPSPASNLRPLPGDGGYDSADVATWLWRQGSADVNIGTQAQPTAWWINFGSFVSGMGNGVTRLVGFTGIGTLGGGNLTAQIDGDAGQLTRRVGSRYDIGVNARPQSLVLAIGSTGRVASDGSMTLTGGGDLDLRVSGAVNPMGTQGIDHSNGLLTNLRGHSEIKAGQIGAIDLVYGSASFAHNTNETRAFDAFRSTLAYARGGFTLVPGDTTFNVSSLSDQVTADVADPGRLPMEFYSPYVDKSGVNGYGWSWFSLWTKHTAINMTSAGGNIAPNVTSVNTNTDEGIVYPSILRVSAMSGSLFSNGVIPMMLAPSPTGSQLQYLAADSIYASGSATSPSSAPMSAIATPQRPAYLAWMSPIGGSLAPAPDARNYAGDGNRADSRVFPLFAFGANSATGQPNPNLATSMFYAVDGDIIGVSTGRVIKFTGNGNFFEKEPRKGRTWYEGGPVRMQAGRDIVRSGNLVLEDGAQIGSAEFGFTSTGNLFVHSNASDISIVSAGRDILYSTFNVAGPGTLEITAGRNILMEDRASVTSLGPVTSSDTRPGASIAMAAGVGAKGLDYLRFVKPYLDPANLAQTGVPLADQAGKVVKTYESELSTWLAERFGFTGTADEARAFFFALTPDQQRVFARNVYFAELKAGGREYNDPDSPRFGSFLRSRNAIATLAPDVDAAGHPVTYAGDIIMFRGLRTVFNQSTGKYESTPRSGYIRTNFGGDIQLLTPGGRQVIGIEGEAPPAQSGVLTQGGGNIELFSRGSILLGQSRIMTTFGGDILGWSSEGDINAGRGSKSTIVYTPPKREYDLWGNVKLSPVVPSTGAGIATLNPIAEVKPGDVDLLAPLGTIDAGEAGIRVSGNVNFAALQVVNAANVQVQGKSSGLPVVAGVNVSALTNASATASQAATAAQDAVQRERNAARQSQPSIFTVRTLGQGGDAATGGDAGKVAPLRSSLSPATTSYSASNPVQIVGLGEKVDPALWARLSEAERLALRQDR
ncbi:filamentous hemagglutinin family protein [Pandoraea sputorum]|uniref:filamentous haemagglutinin family protein n=1 Tax=Pandoraea sputorum TaxID=93222 RepID=UPI001E35A97B|nr:filamentous haemagglutinin family protein [Pandoraea sputorum]MCE4059574.1 filamentous hemagglutinin family protein [Pandoraea sputorum]